VKEILECTLKILFAKDKRTGEKKAEKQKRKSMKVEKEKQKQNGQELLQQKQNKNSCMCEVSSQCTK